MWHSISWVMTILVMLLSIIGLVFRLPSGFQLRKGLSRRLGTIMIAVGRLGIIISACLHAMALAGSGPGNSDMWSSLTYACLVGILIPFRRPLNQGDKVDDAGPVAS
ncbi:hypothetical protein KDL44_02460 [bacterium]|nr:hypothetical protein [bacterium]